MTGTVLLALLSGTAAIARRLGNGAQVVAGTRPPPGWSGKLWALEQGRRHLQRPFTLLLDADIRLAPGLLARMRQALVGSERAFVSLPAAPALDSRAARLLLPAYAYFFKLLHPFALANDPASRVAAAAGGCLLIRTDVLDQLDAFNHIRGELIDDCALAGVVKRHGMSTWTGLTRDAVSTRPNGGLRGIGEVIARHAYTQLGYSPAVLLGVTALMLALFVVPVAGVWLLPAPLVWLPAAAWAAMASSIVPVLCFYRQNPLWAAALPATALFYLAMCWTSAWRYHLGGQRSAWRGRTYLRSPSS